MEQLQGWPCGCACCPLRQWLAARRQGQHRPAGQGCGQAQPGVQRQHRMHQGHPVAPTLLTGGSPPRPASARAFCRRARLSGAARCVRSSAAECWPPQLGGFFHQPVHAVVGRHAHWPGAPRGGSRSMGRWLSTSTSTLRPMRNTVPSTRRPTAGRQTGSAITGLQAQHLHVARALGREGHGLTGCNGVGVVYAGHDRAEL
jgi:hypothetical protein